MKSITRTHVHSCTARECVHISKHIWRGTTASMLWPLCVVGRVGLSRFRWQMFLTLTLMRNLNCSCVNVYEYALHLDSPLSSSYAEGLQGARLLGSGNPVHSPDAAIRACVSASAGREGSHQPALPTYHAQIPTMLVFSRSTCRSEMPWRLR